MLSAALILVGYCSLIGTFGWQGLAAVAIHVMLMLAFTGLGAKK